MKVTETEVIIPTDGARLPGTLAVVPESPAVVVFAHGSGSGRTSERNRYVATELQLSGISTLLFDLLTDSEEEAEALTHHLRFDIDLLSMRLTTAAQWVIEYSEIADPSIGYFGASTGAAAAIAAAARAPDRIEAIVSRGGRPDLAGLELERLTVPTLFIVGSRDRAVLDINRDAFARLNTEKSLEVVPNATHLFEEPGALEEAAILARRWFVSHLRLAEPREEMLPW